MPAPRSIDSEDVECRAGPCLGSSRFVQARACSDELRSYREATLTAPENSLFVEGGGSGSGDLGRSAARRGFATLRTLVVEAVGTVGNPQGLSKGRWASSPWSLSTGPAISTAPPRGPGVLARLMRCTVWHLPLASESAGDPLPPLSTKSQKTPVTSSSLERRPVLWPETTSHHSSDDPSCGQRSRVITRATTRRMPRDDEASLE